MSDVVELVRRAERLRDQADRLRQEIDELRQDLLRLEAPAERPSTLPVAKQGCLGAAQALARDLGPDFSSEHPHNLTERGADWFTEP